MSGHAHSVDSTHYPIPNIIVHPVEIREPHHIPLTSSSLDDWTSINTNNTTSANFLLPNTSPLCTRKRYRACSDSAIFDSCNAAAAASTSSSSFCPDEMYARRRNIGLSRSQPIQQFSDDESVPSYCLSQRGGREARSLDRRDLRNRHMYAQDLKITRSASDSGYPHSSTEVDDEDYDLSRGHDLSRTNDLTRGHDLSIDWKSSTSSKPKAKELSVKSYCESLHSTGCDSDPASPQKSKSSVMAGKRLKLKKYLQTRYQQSQEYCDDKADKNSTDDEVFQSSSLQQLSPYFMSHSFNGNPSPCISNSNIYKINQHGSLPYTEWRSFEDQPYRQELGQGHHRRDLSPRRLSRIGPLSSSVSSIDRLEQNESNMSSHLTGHSQLKHPSFTHISSPLLNNQSMLNNSNMLSTPAPAPTPTLTSANSDPLQAFRNTQNDNVFALQHMMVTGNSLMTYKCYLCTSSFMDYQSLAVHSLVHKNDSVINFRAEKSSQSVIRSTASVSSSTNATTNKSHVCRVCGRGFTRSDMLTRHTRLHTGLKPYECSVCSQVFSRSDHLHTHLRTHTGEKPYRCMQCSYAAPRRDMITRHSRIHAKQWQRKRNNNNLLATAQSSSLSSNESNSFDIPNIVSKNSLKSFESNEELHYRGTLPHSPTSKIQETWSESTIEPLSDKIPVLNNEPMLNNELGAKLQRYCRTSDAT